MQEKVQEKNYPEKIWTRDFTIICIANFFIFLGFQMTLPTLPLFVKELGGSDQSIGWIVGIFTFSALIFRPYAGQLLETKGRKFVYMFGLVIFALTVGAFAIATSIVALLMIRFIQGIGFGFSSTATGTIATDLIPSNRRGEGMGYFGLSGNLSLAFGPVLGLALVDVITFPQLFLVSAGIVVVAIIISSFVKYKKVERLPDKSTTVKFDIFEKTAIEPSILLFFLTFTFGGIASFLPLYATQKGVEGIELYFLMYAIFLMISRTFAGRIYDLRGHIYVFPPGVIMIFVAMILLAWLPNTILLIVAASIYGLGFGSVQPALQAWAVDKAANNRKGMANATFFSFFDLGIGIGAIIFGWIAQHFGYGYIYITSAVSVFASLMIYIALLVKAKQREQSIS